MRQKRRIHLLRKVAQEHPIIERGKRLVEHVEKRPFFERLIGSPEIVDKLPSNHQGKWLDLSFAKEEFKKNLADLKPEIDRLRNEIALQERMFSRETDPQTKTQIRASIDIMNASLDKMVASLGSERQKLLEMSKEFGAVYSEQAHLVDKGVDEKAFVELNDQGRPTVNKKKLVEYAKAHGRDALPDLEKRLNEYKRELQKGYYEVDRLHQHLSNQTTFSKLGKFSDFVASRPWKSLMTASSVATVVYQLYAVMATAKAAGGDPRPNIPGAQTMNSDLKENLGDISATLVTSKERTDSLIAELEANGKANKTKAVIADLSAKLGAFITKAKATSFSSTDKDQLRSEISSFYQEMISLNSSIAATCQTLKESCAKAERFASDNSAEQQTIADIKQLFREKIQPYIAFLENDKQTLDGAIRLYQTKR